MNAMLEEFGVKTNEEQSKQILEKIKVLGDQGKQITDVELLSMASDVLGEKGIKKLYNYLDSLYLLELELCPMHL